MLAWKGHVGVYHTGEKRHKCHIYLEAYVAVKRGTLTGATGLPVVKANQAFVTALQKP